MTEDVSMDVMCDSAPGYTRTHPWERDRFGYETSRTIYVDEYMRTSQKDVFAIGDCALKRHFLTNSLSQ